jgi:hypothetical protein
MTFEEKLSAVFGLDDETWMRHANPWSVWTRTTVLPALVVSFWSRVWIGWWSAVPVVISVLWMFLNPRLFPEPESTDNWASKAVLGERVWKNRDETPVPAVHEKAPHILNVVSAAGTVMLAWGVYRLHVWFTLTGLVLAFVGKLWFLDRMVWLYEDMEDVGEYGEWLY